MQRHTVETEEPELPAVCPYDIPDGDPRPSGEVDL